MAAFQSGGFVGGVMAAFLAGMVPVAVAGVDLVRRFLKELADEFRGGFENGGAQQFFQIGDQNAAGPGGAEGGGQFLDFFLPGEVEGFGIRRFFWRRCVRRAIGRKPRRALFFPISPFSEKPAGGIPWDRLRSARAEITTPIKSGQTVCFDFGEIEPGVFLQGFTTVQATDPTGRPVENF